MDYFDVSVKWLEWMDGFWQWPHGPYQMISRSWICIAPPTPQWWGQRYDSVGSDLVPRHLFRGSTRYKIGQTRAEWAESQRRHNSFTDKSNWAPHANWTWSAHVLYRSVLQLAFICINHKCWLKEVKYLIGYVRTVTEAALSASALWLWWTPVWSRDNITWRIEDLILGTYEIC